MDLGKPIARGNTASVFLNDDGLIKLFHESCPAKEAEYEANKQRIAYSCGLPVPEIYDVTEINGRRAIIMEYIPGKTIAELIREDRANAPHYIELSVDVQMEIHKTYADALESMEEKLRRQISAAPLLSDKQKTALIDRMQSLPYEKRLCHGDYHISNLLFAKDKVTIIDWVDASSGDVKADVYRTYLLYSGFSDELAKKHVRLYCEKSGLSEESVFAWEPIVAGARLAENVTGENAARLLELVEKRCTP